MGKKNVVHAHRILFSHKRVSSCYFNNMGIVGCYLLNEIHTHEWALYTFIPGVYRLFRGWGGKQEGKDGEWLIIEYKVTVPGE